MKNITLFSFLTFITFVAHSVNAQERETIIFYPNHINKTIIREYAYPATVSYVDVGDTHYFAYADNTMTVINKPIDKNIDVYDFVILDSIAYFCGRDKLKGLGVWGWFKVPDIFGGTFNYYVYEDFNYNSLKVDTLFQLVAYKDSSVHKDHIGMVGTIDQTYSCTLELIGSTNSYSGWNYKIGVRDKQLETLTNICLTDKFVVTGGGDEHNISYEHLRFYRRQSMFATGGPQDTIYIYELDYNVDNYAAPLKSFAMTGIGDSMVAVAEFYDIHHINTIGQSFITVNVYDFNKFKNQLGVYQEYSWDLASICNYSDISNIWIRDLRFSKNGSELILLVQGDNAFIVNGFNCRSAIFEFTIPYSTLYNITLFPDKRLYSLDNYQNAYGAEGDVLYYKTGAFCLTQPVNNVSICENYRQVRLNTLVYSEKNHLWPFALYDKNFDCTIFKEEDELILNNNPECGFE